MSAGFRDALLCQQLPWSHPCWGWWFRGCLEWTQLVAPTPSGCPPLCAFCPAFCRSSHRGRSLNSRLALAIKAQNLAGIMCLKRSQSKSTSVSTYQDTSSQGCLSGTAFSSLDARSFVGLFLFYFLSIAVPQDLPLNLILKSFLVKVQNFCH